MILDKFMKIIKDIFNIFLTNEILMINKIRMFNYPLIKSDLVPSNPCPSREDFECNSKLKLKQKL